MSITQTTLERVTTICLDQFGGNPADIKPESRFIEDLGADSLDTVELIMAFEEEWGLDISDDDAEKCTTIGAAVELMDRLAGQVIQDQ